MESQPQNPEFRNNPENFHPCKPNRPAKLTAKPCLIKFTGWLRHWICNSKHKSIYLFLDKSQVAKHLKPSKK